MGKAVGFYIEAIREKLRDADPSDRLWTEEALEAHVQEAVRDISRFCPRERKFAVKTIADTRDVSVADLDDLVEVFRVENPVGYTPRYFHNWERFGDVLTLDIEGTFDDDETTLTGTLTFSKDSTAVTGSGTAFESECTAGQFIRRSTDTLCYRIASVTSDTALVLAEEYQGTSGADTEDATCYRGTDEVAYVWYGAQHEMGGSSGSLPARLDELAIKGGAAYAALDFAGKGRAQIQDAFDKLTDVDTALDNVATRIAAAVTDLTTGAASIGLKATEANTAIGNMTARLTQAIADIASARTYMNKVNVGGPNVPEEYLGAGGRELNTALSYLDQAKGYLAEDQPAAEYATYAARELGNAGGYVSEARGHLSMASSRFNGANLIAGYHRWALAELEAFKAELRSQRTWRVRDTYST